MATTFMQLTEFRGIRNFSGVPEINRKAFRKKLLAALTSDGRQSP